MAHIFEEVWGGWIWLRKITLPLWHCPRAEPQYHKGSCHPEYSPGHLSALQALWPGCLLTHLAKRPLEAVRLRHRKANRGKIRRLLQPSQDWLAVLSTAARATSLAFTRLQSVKTEKSSHTFAVSSLSDSCNPNLRVVRPHTSLCVCPGNDSFGNLNNSLLSKNKK